MKKIRMNFLGLMLLIFAHTVSAQPQWTWDTGQQNNNGSISIKSVTGASVYTGTQNATGGAAKVNQTAVNQPPTVVLATASLPIRAVGATCVAKTTGSESNQIADEGTAITSDRTSLLTCQSGKWEKNSGSSGETILKPISYYNGKYTIIASSQGNCSNPYPGCSGEVYWQYRVIPDPVRGKSIIQYTAGRNGTDGGWRPACDNLYYGSYECPSLMYNGGYNQPGGRLRITPAGIETSAGMFYWIE